MSIRKAGQVIAGTPNITTGHHVGEIFWTSRLDDELNGAVEADGTIYSVEAFTGEKSVPALLADGKLPSVSMAEYESIVSTNGSCRAWGWDNGDTFRVPTLKDVYLMAGQAESAGEFISESLPNITDVYNGYWGGLNVYSSSTGLFQATTGGSYTAGVFASEKSRNNFVSFDASRVSSTYQDGAKVRPDSVRYRAMVQLATGATDEALETCTGVLADVADLKQTTLRTDQITNCITEIPQDIKLELNNGVLTLKAGSKVYVPNGVGNFDEIVISSDITADTSAYSGVYVLSMVNGNPHKVTIITDPVSGNTAPTSPEALQGWYDTTNNLVKRYNNGWQTQIHSFPLAICTSNGTQITSIDQVFNGFGYIGSTVFALPNVKGLIPNGRNADGTLKNIEFNIGVVETHTITSGWGTGVEGWWLNDTNLDIHRATRATYFQDSKPSPPLQEAYWFSPKENILRQTTDTGATWTQIQGSYAFNISFTSGKITSLTPKLPFQAVDRNDSSWLQAKFDAKANTDASNFTAAGKANIVGWGMPNWNARVSIATNYTFSKKGWLLVWQYTLRNVTTNLNGVEILRTDGGHDYLGANHNNIFIPVDVGDKLTGSLTGAIFIPCKGV